VFTERTSVGLDVHARSVAAAAIDGVTGELFQTRLTPAHDHIRSWIRELPGPVAVTYEAGPTGFGLYRALTAAGIRCEVAAPSKLQKPSGDRVKTDAKDAIHLARLLRLDEITPVTVPSIEAETARDLVRAREDCRSDLMRARHRLSKLLLRHGIVYYGGSAWTRQHDAWLRRQRFDITATRLTFESDYDTVVTTVARRDRLDAAIAAMAAASEFTPMVRRLACLRGVIDADRVRARGRDRRLEQVHRPHHRLLRGPGAQRALLAGTSRTQGPITKTGNGHARRLLVEAAWHHRVPYRPGKTMRDRWELATPAARARGDLGNRRLRARWVGFVERKKKSTVANTAIARELAGWCWSLAVLEE